MSSKRIIKDLKIGKIKFKVVCGRILKDCGYWSKMSNLRWEPATIQFLLRHLDKKFTYVDLGCHIGLTSIFPSYLCEHVYAIDADPKAIKSMKENKKINDIKNITIYKGAITSYNGKIKFGTASLGNSTSSISGKNRKHNWRVDCLTLESFFEKYKINEQLCNIIKMDIEGSELIVLPEAKTFLKKFKPYLHLSLHNNKFIKKYEKKKCKILDSLSYVYDKAYYVNEQEEISFKELYKMNKLPNVLVFK